MSAEASLADCDVPSSAAIVGLQLADVSLDTLTARPTALSAPSYIEVTYSYFKLKSNCFLNSCGSFFVVLLFHVQPYKNKVAAILGIERRS